MRYAAFPDGPGGGNPAGVVLDASRLDDAARLAIAAALGYSETAFLDRSDDDEIFRVRYWSPLAEVAFCGHATVAAAVAIAERRGPGDLVFHTAAGRIPVRTRSTSSGIAATLTSVPTRSRPAAPDELGPALLALRWEAADLDPRYPPHVAFAGNEHLVLAARTRARLADLDYDFEALAELMAARSWTTLHLVYAEGPTLFRARDPFPPGGVVEDPATGAAAAAFGGYLRVLGVLPLPAAVTILQGEDMGRPSRLTVNVRPDTDLVQVSGTAAQLPRPPA